MFVWNIISSKSKCDYKIHPIVLRASIPTSHDYPSTTYNTGQHLHCHQHQWWNRRYFLSSDIIHALIIDAPASDEWTQGDDGIFWCHSQPTQVNAPQRWRESDTFALSSLDKPACIIIRFLVVFDSDSQRVNPSHSISWHFMPWSKHSSEITLKWGESTIFTLSSTQSLSLALSPTSPNSSRNYGVTDNQSLLKTIIFIIHAILIFILILICILTVATFSILITIIIFHIDLGDQKSRTRKNQPVPIRLTPPTILQGTPVNCPGIKRER